MEAADTKVESYCHKREMWLLEPLRKVNSFNLRNLLFINCLDTNYDVMFVVFEYPAGFDSAEIVNVYHPTLSTEINWGNGMVS